MIEEKKRDSSSKRKSPSPEVLREQTKSFTDGKLSPCSLIGDYQGVDCEIHRGAEAATCQGCSEQIRDHFFLSAQGQHWHTYCLKCSVCDLALESEVKCFIKNSVVYCREHYFKLFHTLQMCTACSRAIECGAMVMRARDAVFHVPCFACVICRSVLTAGDRFGLMDDVLYCERHYQQYGYGGPFAMAAGSAINHGTAMNHGEGSPVGLVMGIGPGQRSAAVQGRIEGSGPDRADIKPGPELLGASGHYGVTGSGHIAGGTQTGIGHRSNGSSEMNGNGYGYQPHCVSNQGSMNMINGMLPSPGSSASGVMMGNTPMIGNSAMMANGMPTGIRPDPCLNGLGGVGGPQMSYVGGIMGGYEGDYSLAGKVSRSRKRKHADDGSGGSDVFCGGSRPAKQKRIRTSFKHNQVRIMKAYFEENHNPDAKDLKTLSQQTQLSKRVLQVWFQNARAKYRKSLKNQSGETESSEGAGGDNLTSLTSNRSQPSSPGSAIGSQYTYSEDEEQTQGELQYNFPHSTTATSSESGGADALQSETIANEEHRVQIANVQSPAQSPVAASSLTAVVIKPEADL